MTGVEQVESTLPMGKRNGLPRGGRLSKVFPNHNWDVLYGIPVQKLSRKCLYGICTFPPQFTSRLSRFLLRLEGHLPGGCSAHSALQNSHFNSLDPKYKFALPVIPSDPD